LFIEDKLYVALIHKVLHVYLLPVAFLCVPIVGSCRAIPAGFRA
jgi:hypothetical protein